MLTATQTPFGSSKWRGTSCSLTTPLWSSKVGAKTYRYIDACIKIIDTFIHHILYIHTITHTTPIYFTPGGSNSPGNGNPEYVYYQVGGDATLEKASAVIGSVLAYGGIEAEFGVVVQGRLLAR
jgi:hypothetical protein